MGLSALGNQCQNNAGKDGFCRRHRAGNKTLDLRSRLQLVCKLCGSTLLVRKSAEKNHFGEKPTYYLCHICNRAYNHQKPDGCILIHHGQLGSFSGFTVRKPSEEEADAVLRAKALLAQVYWPNGYADT
jgi:hypothetical protein